jgi:excisionase family DNA binding protein
MTLSVRETADELGVSRNTVYDLIRAGDLPHLRIGTRIRIPTDPLRDWIAARTEGSTSWQFTR